MTYQINLEKPLLHSSLGYSIILREKLGLKPRPLAGNFLVDFFSLVMLLCFLVHKKYTSRGWTIRDKKRTGRQVLRLLPK